MNKEALAVGFGVGVASSIIASALTIWLTPVFVDLHIPVDCPVVESIKTPHSK